MEWVNRKPDDHLECIGVKWCRDCGELIPRWAKCQCAASLPDKEGRERRIRQLGRERARRSYARRTLAA